MLVSPGHVGRVGKANRKLGLGSLVFGNAKTGTLITAATVKPSQARVTLWDNFFNALDAASITATDLKVLQVYAANDSQIALVNWMNPGTYNGTAINSPTFTVNRGFTGNSTTSYVDTGFNRTTAGIALNNGMIGAWSLTDNNNNTTICGTADTYINPRNATNFIVSASQNVSSRIGTVTVADSLGLYALDRSSSANWVDYKNGVAVETKSRTATTVSNVNDFVGGRNNAGSLASGSLREIAAYFGGNSLGATKQLALYNALHGYLTGVGAV